MSLKSCRPIDGLNCDKRGSGLKDIEDSYMPLADFILGILRLG